MAGPEDRGLPTGGANDFGEDRYFMSFWTTRFDADETCKLYVPAMSGWGGNTVVLMPNGMIGNGNCRIASIAQPSLRKSFI